jgi:flavin-dependent dehydrogenase
MSRQSNLLADLLSCARPLIPKPVATASIPYGFLRTKQIAPLVFPVGDQLAVVPSFTGDGMAMAISTGLVAARAILAGQSATDYQRDMVWRLRREFRIARGIGRLLEMDVTSSIMVGAASVLPSLMTKMAASIRFRHPQL